MAYTKVVISDPLYMQPDTYSAQDDRRAWADFISPGVVGVNDFLVTWVSALTVQVAAGVAYVPGLNVADQGLYRQRESGNTNIAVGAGDATNPRLDQIILRVLDHVHDTSGLDEARIEVVPGTPTSGATLVNRNGAADLTALTENSKSVLLLADVLVPAGASAISGAAIGDKRAVAKLGGASGGVTSFYDNTLAVDTANFDITGIPAGANLEIYTYLRTTQAAISSSANLRFNNDSAANYDSQRLRGAGATASAAFTAGATSGLFTDAPGASATANKFAATHILIPNYAGGVGHTTVIARTSHVEGIASGDMYAEQYNVVWRSIAAINRVTLLPVSGNFKAGSRCTVYVK